MERTGKRPTSKQAQFLYDLTGTSQIEDQYEAVNAMLARKDQEYMGLLKEQATTSLSCFVEYMTPEEPPAHHHDVLCGYLEAIEKREIMRATFSLHPGSAKTKFCSRYFVAWYLGKNPRHRYLQGGHSQDFCEREFGAPVRNIIQNPRYNEIFPNTSLTSRSTASSSWVLDNRVGQYRTKGVGQLIAGIRGNCGGADDLIGSKEQADSPIVRDKVWKWLWADFRTRFLPFSPIFVIATRWHEDDPIGRIEKYNREGRGTPWEIINFNAIIENEVEAALDPLGRDIGEALWPEYYSREILMELKDTLDARDWNALYKGKPTDEAGGACKSAWFGRFDTVPRDEVSSSGSLLKKIRRRVTVSVDTANKDTKRAKYTAIGVWVEDMQRRHYLVEVVRKKLEFNDLITEIENAATRWNANAILVEDKGSGTQYIQLRRGHAPAPIIGFTPGAVDKAFRFDGVLPLIESGAVLLPLRGGWLADYEAEILAFPNGTYSDQVDMTSQYLKWARVGRKYGTKRMGGSENAGGTQER